MSKGNHFLGTAQGKVGDAVFYRANGEQRTRVLVTPKNPRSLAQMLQRVKIANVAALYRAARLVLKDSFEIRRANESSYNAFARNAIAISPYMTKDMVAACLALPMPAQASRGSLVPIEGFKSADGYVMLNAYGIDAATDTIGQYSAAFIAANPTYRNGDVITILVVKFLANANAGVENAYNASSAYMTLILDTESTETLADAGFSLAGDGGPQYLVPDNVSLEGVLMTAVIGSRKDEDGKLLVSSQYFSLSDDAETLYETFRSQAAADNATLSYGVGEVSPINQ